MPHLTWNTGFQQVADRVFCYVTNGQTMMSNCLLVAGDECALLFDVLCTKPMTREFLDECRRYTDKPIRYLVISHAHGDHFLGAAAVPEGAVVLGHPSLKPSFDQDLASGRAEGLKKRLPHLDWTDTTFPYPDIYLDGGCRIDLGGRTVDVMDMGQCHSAGDLALSIPDAKFMALADVLFYQVVPPTVSGDIDHWLDMLDALEQSGAERFLPGHGPVCGREGLAALKNYLLRVCAQARAVVDGKLELTDDVPSPLEAEMIRAGWLETARTLFSTEQYAARLRGVPYHAELTRILGLEKSRNG